MAKIAGMENDLGDTEESLVESMRIEIPTRILHFQAKKCIPAFSKTMHMAAHVAHMSCAHVCVRFASCASVANFL